MPPRIEPALEQGEVLISFEPGGGGALDEGWIIALQENALVMQSGTDQSERQPFSGLTVGQLADVLRARHGVEAVAYRPDLPAHHIGSIRFDPQSEERPLQTEGAGIDEPRGLRLGPHQTIHLTAERSSVSLVAALSILYAMAGVSDGSGLLDSGGFQLSLTGSARMQSPIDSSHDLYARIRTSLSTNEPLPVAVPDAEEANAVTSAVEQADQISISTQLDYVFNPGSKYEIAAIAVGHLNFAALEPFALPDIIDGDPELAEAASTELEELDRILPTSSFGVEVQFRTPGPEDYLFYWGGGLLSREQVIRSVEYQVLEATFDSTGVEVLPERVDPASLDATINLKRNLFWQVGFGARLAGLVDLRIDALGPAGGKIQYDPFLRVLLAVPFRVAGG